MKLFKVICISIAVLSMQACCTKPAERWSEQKAQEWWDAQEWPVGCNYIPATAINQIEMWSSDTYDHETIDKELDLAEEIGFNTLRVYLSSVVWKNDPEGLKERMEDFLKLCDEHSMKALFVFFDDCWSPESEYGPQPAPKTGVHNSGWVRDPSMSLRTDTTSLFPILKAYVKDVITTFKDDERILMWDLYNEPRNRTLQDDPAVFQAFDDGTVSEADIKYAGNGTIHLLKNVFTWAREVNPSQPLTVGVWNYTKSQNFDLTAYSLNNSDIISYHNYSNPGEHKACIKYLSLLNRPMICTEYMARPNGSLFTNTLPILKNKKIGAINWGFVAGKTNTIYSWGKPIPSGEEPEVWHHDIFRPSGEPYSQEEIDCIKSLTAK